MSRRVALVAIAALLAAGCGGNDDNAGTNNGPPRSEERIYAGMTRAEARDAIEQTIPDANQWIAENAGNAQVSETAPIEPLTDFIPDSGGKEAWAVQLPLEGQLLGNPNADICIWVWVDPVDEGYFRYEYNICG